MNNAHAMDLEPWAMSNMGIRPESLRFKTPYASCNDVVDPNPQMMQVEFADNAVIDESVLMDRYERMAIDNWDNSWEESLYDQALWEADFDNLYGHNVLMKMIEERKLERQSQFEFGQDNRVVHGRKLWFEKADSLRGYDRFKDMTTTQRDRRCRHRSYRGSQCRAMRITKK